MLGFIDTMRAEGHAVESIIRVLHEQGVKIAARTYRAWRQGLVSTRTVTDALVVDAVRDWAMEMIRQLKVAHDTAIKDRTGAMITLKAMRVHVQATTRYPPLDPRLR